MAGVTLRSYFDEKLIGGFHRSIPCRVLIDETEYPYTKSVKKELLSLSENPTLGEFYDKVPSMSTDCEWQFQDGFLTLGNIYHSKDKENPFKVITFVDLDVREWVKTLVESDPWKLIWLIAKSSWKWSSKNPLEGNVYSNGGVIDKEKAEQFCKIWT